MLPTAQKLYLLPLMICCQFIFVVADSSHVIAKVTAIPKESEISRINPSHFENTNPIKGMAYYYAKRYHGKRTSSGAVLDPHKLTAAHPTLSFGKRLKVTNRANKQSVIVTVNDRCPKRNFEYIDLSREAAYRLGFLGKGVARVKWIEVAK